MSGLTVSERGFQLAVVDLAQLCRWRVFHVHDSRRSAPGWPDLVCLRGARFVAAELKSAKGRVRPEHRHWPEIHRVLR